jgi:hypothetical protein
MRRILHGRALVVQLLFGGGSQECLTIGEQPQWLVLAAAGETISLPGLAQIA